MGNVGGGKWGGKRGEDGGDEGGGLGIGGGVTSPPSQNSPYGGQMSQNLHWNTQFLRFYKNHYFIAVLDSE